VAKGYKVVYWNLDLNDWNVKISKASLLNSYKKAIEESDPKVKSFISLQHDMRINSVELVPDIAKMIRDQGFKIVSLAEGL
jgi:peptidoglycan/xylan/chitin deacetylase (PgdA/CDA1 family)